MDILCMKSYDGHKQLSQHKVGTLLVHAFDTIYSYVAFFKHRREQNHDYNVIEGIVTFCTNAVLIIVMRWVISVLPIFYYL